MRLRNPFQRRLEELEAALLPKGRLFVMDVDIDDPDYEAKVAAFKIEHGVKPSDRCITVRFLNDHDPEPDTMPTMPRRFLRPKLSIPQSVMRASSCPTTSATVRIANPRGPCVEGGAVRDEPVPHCCGPPPPAPGHRFPVLRCRR